MRISRIAASVFVTAASIVLLAGCADSDVAAPTASADHTASPAPVEVEVVETEPQTVFDGDCAQLLSREDADAITGATVTSGEPFYEIGDVAIRQLGGIYCGWSDHVQDGSYLSLVVIPTRAATDPGSDSCQPDYGCSFASSASGFELYGVVVDSAATEATLSERAAAAEKAFVAAVSTQAVPDAYAPASAWSVPIDCATLDSTGVIATTIGFRTGSDAELNAGYYGAEAVSGALCAWNAASSGFSARILPGGAWIAGELAATDGAQTATVPGADSALMIDGMLHIFDGDNWIAVAGNFVDAPMDQAVASSLGTALIAELDARR